MSEVQGKRDDLDNEIRELLRKSRNIDVPHDASLIAEQCIEIAARALDLRAVMMRPKRREMQREYLPA